MVQSRARVSANRRWFILSAAGIALGGTFSGLPADAAGLLASAKPYTPLAGPRSRTIFINDLSGDIDGLFACVHQILSTSTELRAIVGTGTGRGDEMAERSASLAREMLELMGMSGRVKAYPGAAAKLAAANVPTPSPGTQAIIDEAMRAPTPSYHCSSRSAAGSRRSPAP